jgi:acyl-CoA thioester hydrolase
MAEHVLRLRVRYAETDQMGVVYHANYLVYMEEGRTRLMDELGFPYHVLERQGTGLVVRRAEVRYRAPARYGDEIEIRTRVAQLRAAAVVFDYSLVRVSDSTLLAEGRTELACLDLLGDVRRPQMLPSPIRSALEGHRQR